MLGDWQFRRDSATCPFTDKKPLYTIVAENPPSANTAYKNIGFRGRALTKNVRAWKNKTIALCGAQMNAHKRNKYPIDFPICAILTVVFNDKKRRDASNYEKVFTDCLTDAGVIKDDNLIQTYAHQKYVDKSLKNHIGFIDLYAAASPKEIFRFFG